MFKMPDAVSDAIRFAVEEGTLKPEEQEEAKEVCRKWVEYGEYVYLDVDTKKRTAKVRPVKPD